MNSVCINVSAVVNLKSKIEKTVEGKEVLVRRATSWQAGENRNGTLAAGWLPSFCLLYILTYFIGKYNARGRSDVEQTKQDRHPGDRNHFVRSQNPGSCGWL